MRLALLSALLLSAGQPAGSAAQWLLNADYEGAFGGNGVAEGWVNVSYSSWGDCDIALARETQNPHGGRACQRITCNRIGYISRTRTSYIGHGATQVHTAAPVALRQGGVYRVRAWLRADAPISMAVQLRQKAGSWRIHCEQLLPLGAAWQPVEFLWTATVDDPEACLMLRFCELGTVWVDDASVEALAPEEARRLAPAPPAGNLLHNGDFDLGVANWMGAAAWESLQDPSFTPENRGADPCLRVTLPLSTTNAAHSDVVPVVPGYPLQISCRIRAAVPTRVSFGAYRQGANHALPEYCSVQATADKEWQTLRASGSVGFLPGGTHAFVRLVINGPTTLWIDDVQLRQDGQETRVQRPRAAIVSDRHPLALYHDGDRPLLRVLSAVPPGGRATLAWSVRDFWGKVVLSGTWEPREGRQELAIPCSRLTRGWYHAAVSWEHEGRPLRNECTFCLLPPAARTGKVDESPFGAHFQVGPAHIGLAHSVGARWLRLWPPTFSLWSHVEPKRGEWHWDDEILRDVTQKQGIRVLGMLENPPAWATGTPEEHWRDWESYVAAVVGRYRGYIHLWECQNEPDLRYWLSQPGGPSRAEAHLEALRHTYPIIKRIDPTATVLGGCASGPYAQDSDGLQFAEELIERGALQVMDVLSFHYYHGYANAAPMDEEKDPVDASVARIRARMRAAGKELPIMNTEGGTYSPASSITYRPCAPDNVGALAGQQVAMLMTRQYVAQWAAGVQRFFYYNFMIGGSPLATAWDSFVEGDGQPRPDVAAYAVMTWVLDGARFTRTERPSKDAWVHRFNAPAGPLAVAWSRTGTQADVALPGAVRGWDMMGREIRLRQGEPVRLTPEPVYVRLKRQ